MEIPAGPEALSPGWLTDALRAGAAIAGAAVVSYRVAPLAEEKGFYGRVMRVLLDYEHEEAGAPRSLIVKFSSASPEMRRRAAGAYAREVHFYRQAAACTSLRTPKCYYANIDEATGLHILLLEDMAPARSGSRAEGCSLEQAELAIRSVAAFHAAWWENPQVDEFGWLADAPVDFDAEAQQDAHARWWPLFLATAGEGLPQPIRAIGERLGARRGEILRRVFSAPPRTLIHRDFQLDNLVFASAEGGVPFAVLDWQMVSRGRGVCDAAYFISENLRVEERRAAGMDLLHVYWATLVEQGVQGYSFDACLLDYRYCLLQRFGALISTIAAMPFSEEQLRLHVDVLLPRNSAAILDSGAGELLAVTS